MNIIIEIAKNTPIEEIIKQINYKDIDYIRGSIFSILHRRFIDRFQYIKSFEIFKHLLEQLIETDLNYQNSDGRSLLYIAAKNNHIEETKLLLEKQPYPNLKYHTEPINNYTPLTIAIIKGYQEIVKLLLQKAPHFLTQRTKGGNTPLAKSIIYSRANFLFVSPQENITKLILEHISKPLPKPQLQPLRFPTSLRLVVSQPQNKSTPTSSLHLATSTISITDKIWFEKEDLSLMSYNYYRPSYYQHCSYDTLLTRAIDNINLPIVKLLLENGADLYEQNNEKWSPFKQLENLENQVKSNSIIRKHGIPIINLIKNTNIRNNQTKLYLKISKQLSPINQTTKYPKLEIISLSIILEKLEQDIKKTPDFSIDPNSPPPPLIKLPHYQQYNLLTKLISKPKRFIKLSTSPLKYPIHY